MKHPETIPLEQVQVGDEPLSFAFDLQFAAAALEREQLLEISPVRFEGEVASIERGFSLTGRLAYTGRLECSRCLASYPFEQDEQFSLLLYPRRLPEAGEKELEKADLDAFFYDEPEVSVLPIVEERLQLAVPMKPLCRPDCRGLCPRCGAEWNLQSCGCGSDAVDPRWEALRELGAGEGGSG